MSKEVGRLAYRVEGENWVAYWALPDTMKDALYLGQIKLSLVQRPDRKEQFMTLMREAVSDIFEERTGHRMEWPEPRPAPEHERAGRG